MSTSLPPSEIRELIAQVPFLAGLDEALLDEVLAHCQQQTFSRREIIFQQGDPGRAFYIVASGQVLIFRRDEADSQQDHLLDINNPGDVFGELALVSDAIRAGRAVVSSNVAELIRLPTEPLQDLIFSNPQRSRQILGLVTQRLVDQDAETIRQLRQSAEQLMQVNQQLEEAYTRLDHLYTATLVSLNSALDLRDNTTQHHTQRVAAFSQVMGLNCQLSGEAQLTLYHGALLHDVGKIGVPDAILRKPGVLSSEDWEVMRMHPIWGEQIVQEIPFLGQAAILVRQHHERWDGSGYPDGIAHSNIHIGARIFAVADVFDALISPRPYKTPLPHAQARDIILQSAGSHFDPEIVAVFDKTYPQLLHILNERFPIKSAQNNPAHR